MEAGGAVHDYHAVAALIERIADQTGDLERVAEVRIRAGLAFSPEALQQAWEMLTQDSPLEHARLVVEESPDERECPACGRSWAIRREDVAGHVVLCPSCGAPSPIQGDAGIEVLDVTAAPAAL
jgi:hydrogenase nickel incorporation protein HypA/HybF